MNSYDKKDPARRLTRFRRLVSNDAEVLVTGRDCLSTSSSKQVVHMTSVLVEAPDQQGKGRNHSRAVRVEFALPVRQSTRRTPKSRDKRFPEYARACAGVISN
jgi:hypothetical protein